MVLGLYLLIQSKIPYFISKRASYSLKDYIIEAEEVDDEVADALLFPPDGFVTVETEAIMRSFKGASLLYRKTLS